MRKINILGSIITLIMVFIGCEKAKDPAGLRDVAVIPYISDVNPGIFNSTDLANAYVEFKATEPAGKQDRQNHYPWIVSKQFRRDNDK